MTELKPYKGNYYLWLYVPSSAAGGIFATLFILGTAVVIWRMVGTRAWYCSVFVIGAFLEIIGYIARALAKDKTDQLMPYVIQSTLILVAPALFAASVYMVLGRVIRNIGAESLSIVPVRWLTAIFVTGDVFSFLIQASGAGIMVTGDSMTTGEKIILGGLFVQIIIFGLFVVTSGFFHARVRKFRPHLLLDPNNTGWQRIMSMLYAVSALIMIRSVFRVIEYATGSHGYLLAHEWTLYVFDALLMFAVVVLFAWIFPGDLPAKVIDTAEGDELV